MLNTSQADAAIVVERVRDEFSQIGQSSEINGELVYTAFSAGISSYPNYLEPEALQSSADRAMYAAKKSGRSRINLG